MENVEKQHKRVPDVKALSYKGTEEKPDIKIFVSHRIDIDSEIVDNALFVPVRCGAVFDERENVDMLGDDTGDNISEKRMSFCELTVQYWAWKNVQADYYGLCHYRRYPSFSEEQFELAKEERNNGCAVADSLNEETLEKFGLNELAMRKLIEQNDIICMTPIDLRKSGVKDNYDAMVKAPKYHVMKDVEETLEIIAKKYPEMLETALKYLKGTDSWLYNCYVMHATVFNEYCEWLFDILFELEKRIENENYTITQNRTPAAIAERLWGVYLLYLQQQKKYRIKKVPLVFIENTQRNRELFPIASNEVTLVSNFNNNYTEVFTVFLCSILDHISTDVIYDYIILTDDMTEENKMVIESIISNYPNFHIRYYSPKKHLDGVSLFVNNSVYSKDIYYRTIIPFALKNFKKVLVLDVDAICCRDVKDLYETDINDFYAAAVKDVVYQGWLNGFIRDAYDYAINVLHLENPYNYCNSGMLLMNLEKIRCDFDEQFIKCFIDKHQFRVFEQDMINVLFQKHVYFLDPAWNCYTYTNEGVKASIEMSAHIDAERYLKARKKPYIIHYAAHPKPWTNPKSDFAIEFWKYARKSPFYERIMLKMISDNLGTHLTWQYKITGQSRTRDIADEIFPIGSRRRQVLKKIMPKPGSKGWEFLKRIKNMVARLLKL